MSRRNKNKNKCTKKNTFWQSAELNDQTYIYYRNWLISIAMNRFKWLNLPETCDARFLEYVLTFDCAATIAQPRKQKGVFYSTKCVYGAPINVYDNPTSWRSIGNNGWDFKVNNATGVIVWDNRLRVPIVGQLNLFARRLTNFDRVCDINLWQQHHPYIFTAPQEHENDLANVLQQVAGYEPAIIGYSSLMDNVKIDAVKADVDFIVPQIQLAAENYWQQIYKFLGIPNMQEKADRFITDEVETLTSPAEIMALDPLGARREACDKLNKRFGLNVEVVWNQDLLSENYNFMHSEREQEEAKKDDN